MRKNKVVKISRLLLFPILIICIGVLTSCSKGTKQEKEIAKDITEQDRYFQIYNLKLDNYTVTKRQTNKDSKTDYIWFTINGSNLEFEYTADYKLEYLLYNEGWLLEDYELLNSNYTVKSDFDPTDVETKIKQEYNNISLIDKEEKENEVTLTYAAEKREELLTTHYEIEVEAKFEPASWNVTDIKYLEKSRDLNIVGEWTYNDKEGRYYYMHVSKVNKDTATINYLFVNTTGTDEWNYISSDGYQDIEFSTYYSQYTGAHDDVLYFHLKNGSGSPSGMGGDINFGWLWLNETHFVDGKTYCGFTINEKYLTRENKSNSPVIGIDETKKSNAVDDTINNDNMTDAGKVISFLNNGNIDEALKYISSLSEKSSECQKLETEINDFKELYKDYIGVWIEDHDHPEELIISCRYGDKLMLCLELGQTIEGERKLYDLSSMENDTLIFHSTRFEPNKYHYVGYQSYWKTISYHWETDDGLKTIGTDYIKK